MPPKTMSREAFEQLVEAINKYNHSAQMCAKSYIAFAEAMFGVKFIFAPIRFRTGVKSKPNRTRRKQRLTRLRRRHKRQSKARSCKRANKK